MYPIQRDQNRSASARRAALFLLALFVAAGAPALAQVSFNFTAGTGTAMNMSGATELIDAESDDEASPVQELGFSFEFAGSTYTDFSVSSNGLLGLGTSTVSNSFRNERFPCAPGIAAFWDDFYTNADGGVVTTLTGSFPNRVRTVEWRVSPYDDSAITYNMTFQVRLYEGTNAIELWYGSSGEAVFQAGAIGVATCSTDFISIDAVGLTTSRRIVADNTAPASGTLYTLTPVPYTPPPIWITSPAIFDEVCLGEGISFAWDANGPANVKIEISPDSGATWQTVVASTSASGSPYNWSAAPTSLGAGIYHVRISEAGNPSVSDVIEFLLYRPSMTHISAAPLYLWPADNQMHLIDIETSVVGGCNPNTNLHSVTANGGPPGDIQIIDDTQVMLRATCAGAIDARVYTLVYRTTDGALEQFDTIRIPVICSSRWLAGLTPPSAEFWLSVREPNPMPRDFPSLLIFKVPGSCTPVLDVYNLRGKWQKTIYIDPMARLPFGMYVEWNGSGPLGTRLPAGTYILQLTACGMKQVQTITLSDMNARGDYMESRGEE